MDLGEQFQLFLVVGEPYFWEGDIQLAASACLDF
jgi:hypothetical protein